MTAPLSSRTRRASSNSVGSSYRSSSSSASISPRLTTQEADIGIARAFSISAVSSSSLAWTSTSVAFRLGVEFFPKLLQHGVRNQAGDVPAERRYLFDEARRQET